MEKPYILWFDEIGLDDLPLVGGKNASLGEMRKELSKRGVNVPNGFAVTVNAYHAFPGEGIVQDWHDGHGKPKYEGKYPGDTFRARCRRCGKPFREGKPGPKAYL